MNKQICCMSSYVLEIHVVIRNKLVPSASDMKITATSAV